MAFVLTGFLLKGLGTSWGMLLERVTDLVARRLEMRLRLVAGGSEWADCREGGGFSHWVVGSGHAMGFVIGCLGVALMPGPRGRET